MKIIELYETKDSYVGCEDDEYNLEADEIADKNQDYYREYFKSYYRDGEIPVFTSEQPDENGKWTTQPEPDQIPSTGYIGRQKVKRRAGLDYDRDALERTQPNL